MNANRPLLGSYVAGLLGGITGCLLCMGGAAFAQGLLQGTFLNILGADGQQRIQAAVYTAPSEAGQPLIGLSDNSHDLRMLFRLAGSNSSPVIVMKDRQHRDRLVMGLSLNDAGQEPFLATFDNEGHKRMIFGNY